MHLDVQATYGVFAYNQLKGLWELHSVHRSKNDATQNAVRMKERQNVRARIAYGRVLGIDFIYKNDAESVNEV